MKTIKIYLFFTLIVAAITVSAQSPRVEYSVNPDVSTSVYTNNTFNVSSQETSPQDLTFNLDGSKLFVVGRTADKVFEYALTTSFDITTASFSSDFDVSAKETNLQSLIFNDDGTRLFLTGSDTDSVYQYHLTTGFDISTASYSGDALFLEDEDPTVQAIGFDVDGDTLFMFGDTNRTLYQYSLSNPYDIESATLLSTSFDLSSTDTGLQDFVFSANGKKLYVLGLTGDRVYEFDLSAPYDISAPEFLQSFSVSGQASSPTGFAFNDLGNQMLLINDASSDLIHEYSLEDIAFEETLANTGALDGVLTISIFEDNFVNAGSTLTSPTHFSIANAPAGLTPTLSVDASGLFADLVFSGNATANDVANDLNVLEFSFMDAAFQTSTAAAVTNSSLDVAVEVNFRPSEAITIAKSLSYSVNPEVETAQYTNVSFDVSTYETEPVGMVFNHDGSRLFVVGTSTDQVYQFDLSTPYDLSTADFGTDDFNRFSFSDQESTPNGITFKPEGTKMFMVGASGDNVYQYNLASPYDVSSASYSGMSFSVNSEETYPTSVRFNGDGTSMYVLGTNSDVIYQYTLTTPYDLGGVSNSGLSFYIGGGEGTPWEFEFSADGSRFFVIGSSGDAVDAYDLSTPYNISTGSYAGTYSVSSQTGAPTGVTFDDTGTMMYMLSDASSNHYIYQYSLEDVAFEETLANTGVLDGLLTVSLDGDFFENTGGTLTSPTHFSIANAPAGLTPTLTVDASGAFANLVFSGNATVNDVTNDLDALEFSFTDAAFQSSTAAEVTNSSLDVAVEVNFRPSEAITIAKSLSYSVNPEVETAQYTNVSFDVSTYETEPVGMVFNHDGGRLFVVGNSTDRVYQFDLSTPYDLSTAGFGTDEFNRFSFSNEESTPNGITFNPEGTKMFMVGSSSDNVYQYDLASPYDVSSASYSGVSFSVNSEETYPTSIRFNGDGTSMYVLGTNSDVIYQYTLTTPYDLGVVTNSGLSFYIGGGEATPWEFEFTADGSRFFVIGSSGDAVDAYDLSTPYNISTGSYVGTYSVSSQTSAPTGVTFDDTGTMMYVLSYTSSNRFIYQYNLEDVAFEETLANTGMLDGLLTVSLLGDLFENTGGTLTSPTHFSIANAPAGLTPTLTVDASGAFANLVFSGNATANDVTNDLDALEFSFTDDAFQSSTAAEVTNSSLDVAVEVNFRPSEAITIAKSLSYSVNPEVETAQYTNVSFDVSTYETEPVGMVFNHDGGRLFVVGNSTDRVYQFDLSTPYDLSTAGFGTDEFNRFSFSNEESTPNGITFNPEGTKMFMVGSSSDNVYQYDLASPYDVSSASYSGVSFSVNSEETYPTSIRFNGDGTSMYVLGTNSDVIYQYTLTTPYDLGVVTNSGLSFYIGGGEGTPWEFEFTADGSRFFVIGSSGDAVDAYDVSTPYNISTGSYAGTYSVSSQTSAPTGVTFDDTGTMMYVLSYTSSNRFIYQYNLEDVAFEETLANTGEIEGKLIVSISSESFINAGDTLKSPDHFSMTNNPTGLTPFLLVDDNGTMAELAFDGSATANDVTNDLSTFQFTFEDAAFLGAIAEEVANSTEEVSAELNFRPSEAIDVRSLSYRIPIELEDAFYADRLLNVDDQDINSRSINFNHDGSRLFYMGAGTDMIYQYDLSTPYDITTAAFGEVEFNTFYYGNESSDAWGMTFHPEGTVMYLTANDGDLIHQYRLAAPFDISSASYDEKTLSTVAEDNVPISVRLNPEGTSLFLLGSQNDNVYKYELSEAYDISTATYNSVFLDISTEATSASDFVFSPDGSQLFVIGVSGDAVDAYDLTTPFDITTSVLNRTFSVSAQAGYPTGLAFDGTGSSMFVSNDGNPDVVFEYSLDSLAFFETLANTGVLEGSLEIRILGDTLVNAGSTLTAPDHFSISNLPEGITASIAVDPEGIVAELQLSGSTSPNDVSNDLATLNFAFTDAAFLNSSATEITNSVADVGLGVEFRPASALTPDKAMIYSRIPKIANAEYSEVSFDISSQSVAPDEFKFSPDGYRFFVGDWETDMIYQYDLTTPFDISTASFGRTDFNSYFVGNEVTFLQGFHFSPDGTVIFVVDSDSHRVVKYDLASAYDVSSMTYSSSFLDVSEQMDDPHTVRMTPDGMKMYMQDFRSSVFYEYDLSESFDITSAQYNEVSIDLSETQNNPLDFIFDASGQTMYVVDLNLDEVRSYTLAEPYDILSATFFESFYVGSQASVPTAIDFNEFGNKMIISNNGSLDFIFEYDLNNKAFEETSLNDGTLTGTLRVDIANDTFVNAGSQLTTPEHYTIDNLPGGLTPQLSVETDGTLAILEFLGSAIANDTANNVDTLQFAFTDAAFTNSTSSEIRNATLDVPLGIGYLRNPDIDLAITELNATSPVEINLPVTISYQFTNQGTESVIASTTSIYLSDDDQFDTEDELLTTRTEEALEGEATSFITDLQISEGLVAGSYTVFIFIDSEGEVLESNEVNNLTSFPLEVVPNLPNLNPFDVSHPDEATQGQEITVSYSVRNLGIAVAGTSTTRVYLSIDNIVDPTLDVLLASATESEIQPQSTTPREITFSIPSETDPGTYVVILELDALGEVEEVSENDNQRAFTLEVIKVPTADLSVEFLGGQAIDSLSTPTPVRYVISNSGNAASPVTTTAFYLSTDSALNTATDVLITTKSEDTINEGEERSVDEEITLPSNVNPGTYQILVQVDANNLISEVDETNNLAVYRLELRLPGLPPDIDNVTISTSTFELGLGNTLDLSFQVTDRNEDLSSVELRFASGSVNFEDGQINAEVLTSSGSNRYSYTFEESDFDNLGLQYQIVATDAASLTSTTELSLVPVTFSDAIVNEFVAEAVENVGVGETQVDYEMIAIPFQNFMVEDLGMGPQTESTTSGNEVNVFERWAVSGWNGTGFDDLSPQSTMTPGAGYWVISSEAPSISFDEKSTVSEQFFDLNLPQTVGFNLIGNPFLFDLDWTTVVEYNIEIGNLSAGQVDDQLYIYTNGGYTQTTTLPRFQGAFLQSSGAGDLIIPSFAVTGSSGGRGGKSSGRVHSSKDWILPLHLSTPRVYNKVGAVGMKEGANLNRDHYDLPRLPRFSTFIDLSNDLSEEEALSRDIVPYADRYLWNLIIEKSPDAGASVLEWSTELTSSLDDELYLVVPDMNLILDMKAHGSLELEDRTSLDVQIVKGSVEEAFQLIDRRLTRIATVFPNPTSGVIQTMLNLTGIDSEQPVELVLTSLDGKTRDLVFNQNLGSGVHQVRLDLTNYPSGLYLIQMQINGRPVPGMMKVLKSE